MKTNFFILHKKVISNWLLYCSLLLLKTLSVGARKKDGSMRSGAETPSQNHIKHKNTAKTTSPEKVT